jgi:uncharacterized protein YndB with AHSA1/START domain
VTRVFDAPVERLWRAWSSADDVKQWWGPRGFTAPVTTMDFREGGSSLVCMRAPDGMEFCNTWSYQQIDPLQRIEFVMGLAEKDGRQWLQPSLAYRQTSREKCRTSWCLRPTLVERGSR